MQLLAYHADLPIALCIGFGLAHTRVKPAYALPMSLGHFASAAGFCLTGGH